MAAHKKKVEHYFNQKVYRRSFKVGDLVLKQMGTTMRNDDKLRPQWEGPYVVVASNHP